MLLPVVGLIAIALCGLILFGLGSQQVGLPALLVGVVAALVPVGVVVAAMLWVDRWEPEPAKLLLLAFFWGACVATITALLVNDTAAALGGMLLGRDTASTVTAVVSAPFIEEAVKGAFLIIVVVWRRHEFDGVVDGIVYAGFSAAGFAFTENISYFGQAFAEYGLGSGTSPGVIATFIVRGVLSPFTHPLFTVLTGIGIGVAAWTTSKRLRFLAPLAGYLAAVCLHVLWNAAATLGGATTFLNVYFLIMVPIFIGVASLVSWQRRREQRIVAAALPAMANARWIAPSEVDLLASLSGRRGWRRQAARESGRPAAKAVGEYQAAVTELAFLRRGKAASVPGEGQRRRQEELLGVLRASRTKAVRLAGGTATDSGGRAAR